MIDQKLINRINELAKKNKEEGLTDEELVERESLRKEYLHQFRNGFRNYLDNIDVVDEEGNVIDLKEKKSKVN